MIIARSHSFGNLPDDIDFSNNMDSGSHTCSTGYFKKKECNSSGSGVLLLSSLRIFILIVSGGNFITFGGGPVKFVSIVRTLVLSSSVKMLLMYLFSASAFVLGE